MTPQFCFRRAIVALVLAVLSTLPAAAQTNRVTFPGNFDAMVMYGDYRRGTGGELAYALQETIDTAQAGLPLPNGTVLVLEIYNNGALTDYFVMEKGQDWGLDFPEDVRNGDWHFQQYDPSRNVRRTAFADRCMACHQGAGAESEFMFSYNRMLSYMP